METPANSHHLPERMCELMSEKNETKVMLQQEEDEEEEEECRLQLDSPCSISC